MMKNLYLIISLMVSMLFFSGGISSLAQSNADKTIVLISEPLHFNDEWQYKWLVANGFNVTRLNAGINGNIDLNIVSEANLDQLNAADLVILGRGSWGGSLVGNVLLDSLTTPVIYNNPFRVSGFFNTPDWDFAAGKDIYTHVDITDPIFANSHVVGDSIIFANKSCAFIATTGGDNGKVVASHMGNNGIVRFTKNVPYNVALGATAPDSDHTLFAFADTDKSFSLSLDGQAAYYGEIRRLIGLAIEAPKVYSGNTSDRTIVLISDPLHFNDEWQFKWLLANGFNVTRLNAGTDGNIDLNIVSQANLDQLNAADLVILGRGSWGGALVGNVLLDSITTPVIYNNPFRVSGFFNTPGWDFAADKDIYTHVDNTDPIFANSHVAGDSILYANGKCSFFTSTGGDNGAVVASHVGNSGVVRFAKNVAYNDVLGVAAPRSNHTIFAFEDNAKSFSLSPDGQAAYFGEISRMTGLPIIAPAFTYFNNSLKSIVLISDPLHGNDEAQYTWLVSNDFAVTQLNAAVDIDLNDASQANLDVLNAADLVICGRGSWGGSLVGNVLLDNITTPVIYNNPFRVSGFFNTPGWDFAASEDIYTQVDTTDPIFANSNIVGDSILYAKGSCAFIASTGGDNGKIVVSHIGNIGVTRFAKDVPYNDITGVTAPKSDHTLFAFADGPKSFTLSADGQAAYYGEIRRLLGSNVEAPISYYINPSIASTLSSLVVSVGTLTPEFNEATTSYTLEVPIGTTSLTMTSTSTHAKASVVGGGTIDILPSFVTITVTAEDGVSITNYTVDITVTPNAINDFRSAGIRIYPNPAREYVMLDGLSLGSTVNVSSVIGQSVFKTVTTGENMKFSLSSLKSGLYLIKVEMEGKSYSSKFIKQ